MAGKLGICRVRGLEGKAVVIKLGLELSKYAYLYTSIGTLLSLYSQAWYNELTSTKAGSSNSLAT